ncbi:MAG: glucokinase [Hydrogenovibrio sp.]
MPNILAADVGATKVLLRAIDVGRDVMLAEKRYLSADFRSLTDMIQTFQKAFDLPSLDAACLGLPGPVEGRRAQLTNLPWSVDADALESECGIGRVDIINDFYAAALGVDELEEADLVCLQKGEFNPDGNRLVIGAGSGLGVAPVKNCNGAFIPQPSEGGHVDFAPLNLEQDKILTWLRNKWSHVSYERLLSGEGLETLYFFYSLQSHGHGKHGINASEIRQAALQGERIAIQTLDTFVEIYGAYIGNAALIWECQAGIYVAGGIAPKIQDWMTQPRFIHAFLNKGRMKKIVETFPIHLVVNESVGLLGAVKRARSLVS